MEIKDKLRILSDAAKYDVSCSSSGSKRKNTKNGIGNASSSGICHTFTQDGRCVSLLKILMTNYCIYDCSYCINKKSTDSERALFTPDEICNLVINFYKRNYIEGLFLSSAIIKNENYTMEKLYEVVYKLRNKHNFNGYIHLKAIPGACEDLIQRCGMLVDRMSVNIELPSESSLKLLAPDKNKDKILLPMKNIRNNIIQNKEERKKFKNSSLFVPGGQSTQLIVGATDESDYKILNLTSSLYDKYKLKRVYYSAFVNTTNHKNLPDIKNPPTIREHRLYQADWLLRLYGFKAEELLNEDNPNFDINFDPKTDWALKNINLFPIEINKAPYEMLLRVPGIGMKSAQKIIATRRVSNLRFEDLKKLRVTLKRAQYFITCNGIYYGDTKFDEMFIKNRLTPDIDLNIIDNDSSQLSFFDKILNPAQILDPTNLLDDKFSSIMGDL